MDHEPSGAVPGCECHGTSRSSRRAISADAGEDVSPLRAKILGPDLRCGDMDCLGGYHGLSAPERKRHTTRICSCSDKLYAPSLSSAGQSTKQIISNHDPFVNMLKTAEFPRKSLQSRDLGHASECLCQVGLQPREALEIPRGCRAGEIGPRTGTWAKVPCLTVLAGVPWCFDYL